jgi:hypothetical protein
MKKIVIGIPYISIKRDIKNADTRPYSIQLNFLLKDNGIKNDIKITILIITIGHWLTITNENIDPVI